MKIIQFSNVDFICLKIQQLSKTYINYKHSENHKQKIKKTNYLIISF